MFKYWYLIALVILPVTQIFLGMTGSYMLKTLAPKNPNPAGLSAALERELNTNAIFQEEVELAEIAERSMLELKLLSREYETMRNGVSMWNRASITLGLVSLIILGCVVLDIWRQKYRGSA